MRKNYTNKLIIFKLLFTFLMLFNVSVLSSCESGLDKQNYPQAGDETKPGDPVVTKPVTTGPAIDSIQSLDLKSISFTPSLEPLVFTSIAIGDVIAGTNTRAQISLTNSGWTHPSVLYFKDAWNGYHYWCAITPYLNSDPQYENAHIFCSNDGIIWNEPAGIANPIENSPEGTPYSSDVNLVFQDGYLYCYWRDNIFKNRYLLVKKSSDGVNWTSKTIVATWPSKGIDAIAPSIVKSENNFYCYAVCNGETVPGSYYTQYCIRRATSDNMFSFTIDREKNYELINIEGRPWGDKQEPWHTDVQKIGNVWLMLVTTTDNGTYGYRGRLFLGYSLDGINFTFNDNSICNAPGGTYKSGFVPTYDRLNKRMKIQLWRAQVPNNWQVFYDEFFVTVK